MTRVTLHRTPDRGAASTDSEEGPGADADEEHQGARVREANADHCLLPEHLLRVWVLGLGV